LSGTTKSLALSYGFTSPLESILCALDNNVFISANSLGYWNCLSETEKIEWSLYKDNPCGEPGNPVQGKDKDGNWLPNYLCEKFIKNNKTYAKIRGFNHTSAVVIDFCSGDFDCDNDIDGTDAYKFKVDFGKTDCCTVTCNGDFDGDCDVDGTDAFGFKTNFGRSNCPACIE